MKLVEVIQDGAALVNESTAPGIYTTNVATCAVYVLYGRDGIALIHDTGQLAISSMAEIARKCGPISRTVWAYNPELETKSQASRHKERQVRIRAALNLDTVSIEVPTHSGDAYFLGNYTYGTDLSTVAGQLSTIPNREQRLCINELNNLFAPRNAQSLPVDVQFSDGGYRPFPGLLWRIEDMILRAEAERRRGDGDYLWYLDKARRLGIVGAGI